MSVRCHNCGLESTAVDSYHRLDITRKLSPLYCPACWAKRQASVQRSLLLAGLAAAVGGIFLHQYSYEARDLAWYALTFALFMLVQVVCVVPRELGHALGALLVNMRVFTISIGSFGSVLYIVRILGYDVVLRSIPLGGSVLVAPKSTRLVRLRFLFVYLCGPLANVLLMIIGTWLWGSFDHQGLANWACSVFLGANAIILAVNLYPQKVFCGGQLIPNDGLALLTVPLMSRAKVDEWYKMRLVLEGLESRERHRHEEAKVWFDRALAFAPDDATAIGCFGIGLLDVRQYDEARKLFLDLAGRQDDQPDAQAMTCNNVAWADFMTANDDFISEALTFSERAMQRLPWIPQFKATRGSVLVWSGDLDSGINLLTEAFRENYLPGDRASNAAVLALAARKKGDIEQCERYRAVARDLDPDCPLLERAERHAS
jgi:tetratricopeptide (TPR) repeat protein